MNGPQPIASVRATRALPLFSIIFLLPFVVVTWPVILYLLLSGPKVTVFLYKHMIRLEDRPNFFDILLTGNNGNEGIFPIKHVSGFEYGQRSVSGCLLILLVPITLLTIVYASVEEFEMAAMAGIIAFSMFLYAILHGVRINLNIYVDNRLPIRLRTKGNQQFDRFYEQFQYLKMMELGDSAVMQRPPEPMQPQTAPPPYNPDFPYGG